MSIAEAAFKSRSPEPAALAPVATRTALPGAKEIVSIRLDSDVLARFQEDGPGWQDRINAALRKTVGM